MLCKITNKEQFTLKLKVRGTRSTNVFFLTIQSFIKSERFDGFFLNLFLNILER